MTGFQTRLSQDPPPLSRQGEILAAATGGINAEGLRRRGYSADPHHFNQAGLSDDLPAELHLAEAIPNAGVVGRDARFGQDIRLMLGFWPKAEQAASFAGAGAIRLRRCESVHAAGRPATCWRVFCSTVSRLAGPQVETMGIMGHRCSVSFQAWWPGRSSLRFSAMSMHWSRSAERLLEVRREPAAQLDFGLASRCRCRRADAPTSISVLRRCLRASVGRWTDDSALRSPSIWAAAARSVTSQAAKARWDRAVPLPF